MGDDDVDLEPGDLLVVDNMKLHRVVDFPGFDTRVIVISFLPEFVYSLGSPSHDYAFLLPFSSKVHHCPHVLRAGDQHAAATADALVQLLQCYFAEDDRQFREAGCKAFMLEILYHLARRFRASRLLKWEFMRQQERSSRLKGVFDHLSKHFSERITMRDAAVLAGMSSPQFARLFKRVAGTTFVTYLTHLRLSHGQQLLQETDRTIAEIAASAGFADQSYFDKRFKKSFGNSPREFRERQRKKSENRPKL
jgi:AraC-like DNA-binding protein